MDNLTMPKKGEVPRWTIYVMGLLLVSMSGALIALYQRSEDRLKEKDLEIQDCQEKRNAELTRLYKEVQDFREEIYRTSMNQQRQLKRLKK